MLSLQENLDSFLLAAELQLKGLQENQNKDNAETDPIKKDKTQITKPIKKDVAENKYSDGDRNWFESISKETRITLSDQANYTDLGNMDEAVKCMMITTETRIGKQKEKAKKCRTCGKEGPWTSITNHIESVHLTGLQIPCNNCGKTVKSRQSLAKHKENSHSIWRKYF